MPRRRMLSPDPLAVWIERLKASGLAGDALATAIAELEQDLASVSEHACSFCGRSSNTLLLPPPDEMADDPFPSQWVYCYRGGKPYGLCDLCFTGGNYTGLSELEIAYFKESFDHPNEPEAR